MSLHNRSKPAIRLAAGLSVVLSTLSLANAQSGYDPSTSQSFQEVAAGMHVIDYYAFGTGSGTNISNTSQLSQYFSPWGIAGTTVINDEWERYQSFNNNNFVFTSNSLNLTATLNGGVYDGGINSGQFWSRNAYQPGVTGYNVYAFEVRMKIPNGVGMWPAMWFYAQYNADPSEVDLVEFQMMKWQNQYDWTGYDHGPGAGGDIYSIKSNQWVWQPGTDFSAAFHDYELVWTPDATYKYVDGRLIEAQHFTWTAGGPAQFGVNLAVGSYEPGATGLTPNSTSEFPSSLQVQYIGIWAK